MITVRRREVVNAGNGSRSKGGDLADGNGGRDDIVFIGDEEYVAALGGIICLLRQRRLKE